MKSLFSFWLVAMWCTPLSAAVLEVFTERALFDAAVGPTLAEDFNTFDSDTPFHTSAVDVGPFTLSMTGSPLTDGTRNKIDVPPLEEPVMNVDNTTVAQALTTDGTTFLITFKNPISAFGADFAALNEDIDRTRIIIGTDVLAPPVTGGNTVGFYGFRTDSPFTTLEFVTSSLVRPLDGYSLDNVAFSPIPIPGALWLFGSGLLGLIALSKGKKRVIDTTAAPSETV
jgi:hypothetical protein